VVWTNSLQEAKEIAMSSPKIGREHFESSYQAATAPWDIPGPQPALVALEEAGTIEGSVLDVGCGTGENALYLAARGHEVWGIDFVPLAIERAKAKAQDRGLSVHFQQANALELEKLGRQFDTVIDCGLFHTFSDEDRPMYVAGLAKVLRHGGHLHMMCFSDQEPGSEGPRRVTQQEIIDSFRDGWALKAMRDSTFETANYPGAPQFSPGGPKAWLVTILHKAGGSYGR
jgi:ubiquinone/menaquinone biosynthesis C-methylase UbiE